MKCKHSVKYFLFVNLSFTIYSILHSSCKMSPFQFIVILLHVQCTMSSFLFNVSSCRSMYLTLTCNVFYFSKFFFLHEPCKMSPILLNFSYCLYLTHTYLAKCLLLSWTFLIGWILHLSCKMSPIILNFSYCVYLTQILQNVS